MSSSDRVSSARCLAETIIPSRTDQGPLFQEAWHARIFALIVSLVARDQIQWVSFQRRFVSILKENQSPNALLSAEEINEQYFDCWIDAAEEMLMAEGFLSPGDVAERLRSIRASVEEIRESQLSEHIRHAH